MAGTLQEVGEVFTVVLIRRRWRMESERREPGRNLSSWKSKDKQMQRKMLLL